MKNFLMKYFGVLGLLVYYPIALIVRIPVGVFLTLYIILTLMVWNPLTGRDCNPDWVGAVYDWYCGK